LILSQRVGVERNEGVGQPVRVLHKEADAYRGTREEGGERVVVGGGERRGGVGNRHRDERLKSRRVWYAGF